MPFKLIIISLLLFGLNILQAQNQSISVTGMVLESNNNLPIEYATIAILDNTSNQPITGTITAQDGSFSVKTNETNFLIKISFMGFKTKSITDF